MNVTLEYTSNTLYFLIDQWALQLKMLLTGNLPHLLNDVIMQITQFNKRNLTDSWRCIGHASYFREDIQI